MAVFRRRFTIATHEHNEVVDITREVERVMTESRVRDDGWLHDRVDDNAAAHIKSALVGPSVSIPVEEGKLALGTWQDLFFCEFDGPRANRTVIVTIVS